jgi:hypothetical protein
MSRKSRIRPDRKSSGAAFFLAAAALAAGASACAPRDLDAAAAVSRCAEALGGAGRIAKIETMRFECVYPDHGTEAIPWEFGRPNLMRYPNGDLVYDGRRACLLKGPNGKPEFIDEGELPHFETEPALYFPAFFDNPAEMRGKTLLHGVEVYQLVVDLPRGVEVHYFLDAKTFLPLRATARFEFMGKPGEWTRDYFDYREVEGFLVPRTFTYPARNGKVAKATVAGVKINTVDKAAFIIPAGDGVR